jgi:hypothetical protein
MFTVGLGLLPLLANALIAVARRAFDDPSIWAVLIVLFGRGELLILAAGLTATAIGDLALSELSEDLKRLLLPCLRHRGVKFLPSTLDAFLALLHLSVCLRRCSVMTFLSVTRTRAPT